MSHSHLHLLLNHVPTVGAVGTLGLLILAFIRRDESLKRVALEAVFIIALAVMPLFMTGVGSQRELRGRPDVSDTAIRMHQDTALVAFTVMEFAGFVAWLALWQMRRRGHAGRGLVPAVGVILAVALTMMAGVANLGGEIRHPEIRADEAGPPPIDREQFWASQISQYMVNSPWAWPAAETVHFLGLSLSIGVLLAVNLRILGAMSRIPFADVHRLLPWGMLGFGANLITGMLFFVGQPGQYVQSAPFYWKVLFLLIAGVNFLYLTEFRKTWESPAMSASPIDKVVAVSSIVAWLGVLYAGRMLPYLGNAF